MFNAKVTLHKYTKNFKELPFLFWGSLITS